MADAVPVASVAFGEVCQVVDAEQAGTYGARTPPRSVPYSRAAIPAPGDESGPPCRRLRVPEVDPTGLTIFVSNTPPRLQRSSSNQSAIRDASNRAVSADRGPARQCLPEKAGWA
jgi:hypothetical protein